jgi:hypothetical protein
MSALTLADDRTNQFEDNFVGCCSQGEPDGARWWVKRWRRGGAAPNKEGVDRVRTLYHY